MLSEEIELNKQVEVLQALKVASLLCWHVGQPFTLVAQELETQEGGVEGLTPEYANILGRPCCK